MKGKVLIAVLATLGTATVGAVAATVVEEHKRRKKAQEYALDLDAIDDGECDSDGNYDDGWPADWGTEGDEEGCTDTLPGVDEFFNGMEGNTGEFDTDDCDMFGEDDPELQDRLDVAFEDGRQAGILIARHEARLSKGDKLTTPAYYEGFKEGYSVAGGKPFRGWKQGIARKFGRLFGKGDATQESGAEDKGRSFLNVSVFGGESNGYRLTPVDNIPHFEQNASVNFYKVYDTPFDGCVSVLRSGGDMFQPEQVIGYAEKDVLDKITQDNRLSFTDAGVFKNGVYHTNETIEQLRAQAAREQDDTFDGYSDSGFFDPFPQQGTPIGFGEAPVDDGIDDAQLTPSDDFEDSSLDEEGCIADTDSGSDADWGDNSFEEIDMVDPDSEDGE